MAAVLRVHPQVRQEDPCGPTPAAAPELELREVSKSFDGLTPVVSGVSFRAARGELLVLLGESGCGKTTTLKMINRLVDPDQGQILIQGRDIADLPPVTLRRGIGYVFQAAGLFPHLTVAQNVGIPLDLLGWKQQRRDERVAELLQLVRLEPGNFAARYPRQLSGGQRQRVGFARALAAAPRILLLDEPFGALDPITRDHMQQEFREIQQRLQLTAVLVTHDMTEALLMADRILILEAGRIVQQGTPAEVINTPCSDYVNRLMETPRRQARRLEGLMESG